MADVTDDAVLSQWEIHNFGLCTICQEPTLVPERKVDNSGGDDDNDIAYEEQRPVIHIPTCSHVFHMECIKSWFHQRKTCPICKKEVKINADGSITIPKRSASKPPPPPPHPLPQQPRQQPNDDNRRRRRRRMWKSFVPWSLFGIVTNEFSHLRIGADRQNARSKHALLKFLVAILSTAASSGLVFSIYAIMFLAGLRFEDHYSDGSSTPKCAARGYCFSDRTDRSFGEIVACVFGCVVGSVFIKYAFVGLFGWTILCFAVHVVYICFDLDDV